MKFRAYIWFLPILLLVLSGCLGNSDGPAQTETHSEPSPTMFTTAPIQPTTNEATSTTNTIPSIQANPTSTLTPEIINPTPTEPASMDSQVTVEPSPTPPPPSGGSASDTTTIDRGDKNCTDLAAFYGDVNIPDNTTMRQGEQFEKVWRIRNEGTCSWGSDYKLVFASGSSMNGPPENPMPEAAPGDIVEVSVNLTAPNRGGTYASYWEFQNNQGNRFGVGKDNGWVWAQIAVSWVVPGGDSSPSSPEEQPASASGCEVTRDSSFESQLLTIINNAREGRGLKSLDPQTQLAASALAHSTDMACNGFVDHIGSDGSLWYDRVAAQGYANYNSALENMRVGFPDFGFNPQYVYEQWFISQVHHDN
ncbi:MAG: NBR1-Ig-like domain-containing protein, partial [Anaerolineales bacterium]